jgi:uncharacterized protein YjbI with pentapeptide repeats
VTQSEVFELIQVLSASVGIVGGLIVAFRFLRIKSRREQMEAVGQAFRTVVEALASENEIKRLSGAILMRRFFDPISELGVAGTPYANECVNVIAAMLRDPGLPESLQKILADSLGFAPKLKAADLQRANLADAYLGDRIRKGIDVSDTDFFEANLTKASLTGATACRAVFYRANLAKAKLANADLRGADFRCANLERAVFDGANLAGARFDDAILTGASFVGATNIPETVADHFAATPA